MRREKKRDQNAISLQFQGFTPFLSQDSFLQNPFFVISFASSSSSSSSSSLLLVLLHLFFFLPFLLFYSSCGHQLLKTKVGSDNGPHWLLLLLCQWGPLSDPTLGGLWQTKRQPAKTEPPKNALKIGVLCLSSLWGLLQPFSGPLIWSNFGQKWGPLSDPYVILRPHVLYAPPPPRFIHPPPLEGYFQGWGEWGPYKIWPRRKVLGGLSASSVYRWHQIVTVHKLFWGS